MKKIYEAPEVVVLNVNGTEIFTSPEETDDLPANNWG